MTKPFAAYLRTSTEDNQSPEDSRRWQVALAEQLIVPAGGQIVAVYHHIDVSRSVPWSRRPEASRLLADAADRSRGWDALVIGEPQRAFRYVAVATSVASRRLWGWRRSAGALAAMPHRASSGSHVATDAAPFLATQRAPLGPEFRRSGRRVGMNMGADQR
jgi:hypothetical protein